MLGISGRQKMIAERGPRYVVTGTIRGGEFAADYALDSARAEQIYGTYERLGYRQVKVHVPDVPGIDINLSKYGRDRSDALRVAEEKTSVLRAAVLRAAEAGRAEAEIARQAGVDRMTVRKWLGKQ